MNEHEAHMDAQCVDSQLSEMAAEERSRQKDVFILELEDRNVHYRREVRDLKEKYRASERSNQLLTKSIVQRDTYIAELREQVAKFKTANGFLENQIRARDRKIEKIREASGQLVEDFNYNRAVHDSTVKRNRRLLERVESYRRNYEAAMSMHMAAIEDHEETRKRVIELEDEVARLRLDPIERWHSAIDSDEEWYRSLGLEDLFCEEDGEAAPEPEKRKKRRKEPVAQMSTRPGMPPALK